MATGEGGRGTMMMGSKSNGDVPRIWIVAPRAPRQNTRETKGAARNFMMIVPDDKKRVD